MPDSHVLLRAAKLRMIMVAVVDLVMLTRLAALTKSSVGRHVGKLGT